MTKTFMFFFSALFAVSSFASQVETIMGFHTDSEGIHYQVTSGGCTSKDDFSITQLETFPVKFKLIRLQNDDCEAYLPYGTTVTFTWKELGLKMGDKAMMANPISVIHIVE